MFTDSFIQTLVDLGNQILFFNVFFWQDQVKMPFLILWLLISGIFFAIRFKGANFLLIKQGIKLLFSKKFKLAQEKDIKESKIKQEISRDIVVFTIGSCIDMGSIFGIALMVKACGVGSIFWVLVSGIIATSIRLAEVFMGHYYRQLSADKKSYVGGPQIYIKSFFIEKGWKKTGIFLASLFTILLFCSTFSSPSLNQTAVTLRYFAPSIYDYNLLFCFVLSGSVIFIIWGGFSRIVSVATKVVFIMSKVYLLIALLVILINGESLLGLLCQIFTEAFNFKAGLGGFFTMFIFAMQRGFFCNECGMGSGAISHASSVNKNSVQEAVISIVTPIITTSVLCVTSGILIAITNSHLHSDTGLGIVVHALKTVHVNFHYILLILIPLFGVSTAIAWGYYGQRAFEALFGESKLFIYNIILFFSYVTCSFSDNFKAVLNLADIANLGISIPNIITLFFASGFISKKILSEKNNNYKS